MGAFPVWAQAGLWGFVAGAALLIGAAIAYFNNVPQRLMPEIVADDLQRFVQVIQREREQEVQLHR
jgi:hypothetical protein